MSKGGLKTPQKAPNEAPLTPRETLSGMLLRRPVFEELEVFLVLGIHADDLGQADDPADPGLLGLVELVERTVLDGRGPEVQLRADDVVDRPLLGDDLVAHFRCQIQLLLAFRIQVADLAERLIDPGHVALDAELQGRLWRLLGLLGDCRSGSTRIGRRRPVRIGGWSLSGEKVQQRRGAVAEFRAETAKRTFEFR